MPDPQPTARTTSGPAPTPSGRPARLRTALGRALAIVVIVVAAALAGGLAFAAAWLNAQRPEIERLAALAPQCPSRLYGAPATLEVGQRLEPEALEERLGELRYRPGVSAARGTYRTVGDRDAQRYLVGLRPYPVPLGATTSAFRGGGRLEVELRNGKVARLLWEGREWGAGPFPLEPPLLASYRDDTLRECRTVALTALPEHLVEAVLAAEDDAFFEHHGVSLSGIARAAWVNLRSGRIRQGGSTLTQQLIKNVYLSPRRSYARKLREAALALLADRLYSKEQLLEAYLNRIYWGNAGAVQIIGIGAAAEAFFNRDAEELTLAQAALLAGMIRSPGAYDPRRDPQSARARRDRVLDRMLELGWLGELDHRLAVTAPIEVEPGLVGNRVGHFADYAAGEARRRWGLELAGGGHRLLATLRLDDQRAARQAVERQLETLEPGAGLEGALVSVRPADGAILAYVGGRDHAASPFDRAGRARRQVGSLYKPFVYAAAFQRGVVLPGDLVADEPVSIYDGEEVWSPANYDDEFHGMVTVREAVEKSLNIPAVRVALVTGVRDVAATGRALGADPNTTYPSLALGAAEFSPLEMAGAFATFATGGLRPELHGLAAAWTADGLPLEGGPVLPPHRVLDPQTAYLVTSVLQGVVTRGTAWRVRRLGVTDPIAAKTGTSNDWRDAWLAAYSPDRATVVWVGYDDNRSTGHPGGRAAGPVFADFARQVRPGSGFARFERPDGLEEAEIDPESGYLATDACPRRRRELYPSVALPAEACPLHAGPQEAEEGIWIARLDERGEPVETLVAQVGGQQPEAAELASDPESEPEPVVVTASAVTLTGLRDEALRGEALRDDARTVRPLGAASSGTY